jgi:hypothetical protein
MSDSLKEIALTCAIGRQPDNSPKKKPRPRSKLGATAFRARVRAENMINAAKFR